MAACLVIHFEQKPQDDPILKALAYVETRNTPHLVGKDGERSAYQITCNTWQTYTTLCFCKKHTTDPDISSTVAKAHLVWLSKQYVKKNKRNPNPVDIYLMWNMGFRGYARCGFNPIRVAPWRHKKALQFDNQVRIYYGNN